MAPPPDRYLLLLGSNIERESNVARAEALLAGRFPVLGRSRICESDAVGDPLGPRFFNRALWIRAADAPDALRGYLHSVEGSLGRLRTLDRNSPRTIDIDVLLAVDAAGRLLPDPPLHRDLGRHHYAAVPAAEIAGEVVLPGGGTLAAAAAALGPPPRGFVVHPA